MLITQEIFWPFIVLFFLMVHVHLEWSWEMCQPVFVHTSVSQGLKLTRLVCGYSSAGDTAQLVEKYQCTWFLWPLSFNSLCLFGQTTYVFCPSPVKWRHQSELSQSLLGILKINYRSTLWPSLVLCHWFWEPCGGWENHLASQNSPTSIYRQW